MIYSCKFSAAWNVFLYLENIIQTNYVSKNNMTMNDASPTKYFMNDVNEPDDSPIQQKKSQYQNKVIIIIPPKFESNVHV